MIKKILVTVLLVSATITLQPADEVETRTQKIRCLSETVWREARGETWDGKVAVAKVVLNRTKTSPYPNTVCGVVLQRGQFQWTKKWKQDQHDLHSILVANYVLDHNPLPHFKSTHFHNHTVKPRWNLKHTTTIGKHYFYEPKT